MPTGTSIFLIAVGAVLRYAVTASVSGISLGTVGLILMLAGILGLILSLFYMLAWNPRRGQVVRDRVIEHDPTYEERLSAARRRRGPLGRAVGSQRFLFSTARRSSALFMLERPGTPSLRASS